MADKKLYDSEQAQIFGGLCNRIGLCNANALIMLIFSCPSLITSIVNYVTELCGPELTSKICTLLINSTKDILIENIIIEIIETKPMKYFEFVFLLIYIMYVRIKILQKLCKPKYCQYDLYTVNELLFLCLTFYYYGTSIFNNHEINVIINIIKRKPHQLLVVDKFDKNYFNDFMKYVKQINNFKNIIEIKRGIRQLIVFIQFIRDAASLNPQNMRLIYINRLIGEPIFYHDFRRYRFSRYPFYNPNGAKIIFVLNEITAPILGMRNNIYYKERFPEFIDIYITTIKLLRYVLVGMFLDTMPLKNGFHAETICRFYNINDKAEKYYRISNGEVIECGTQEKFISHEEYSSNYFLTCENTRVFEPYTKLAVYHAYKWLT